MLWGGLELAAKGPDLGEDSLGKQSRRKSIVQPFRIFYSLRTTYQHIVDHQSQFAHIWANELGKAYLFTNDYGKAIATLEQSEVISYDQGLFLAFAYLKHGEQQQCATQFQRWIAEDLTRAFAQYTYDKYIKVLFTEAEAQYIDNLL